MLCWNVYCENVNRRTIEVFNIFNHTGFYHDCVKAKKKCKDDRDGFADAVRQSLCYYFWSKCEWEIVLTHWPSGELYNMRKSLKFSELVSGIHYDTAKTALIKPDTEVTVRIFPNYLKDRDRKIDVYEQVVNNWPVFIEYLWANKKELKEKK